MADKQNLNQRYPFILAWGLMMGSYGYYIVGEQEQAAKDGAPYDAIYKLNTVHGERRDSWMTYRDIKRADTKQFIRQTVEKRGVKFDEAGVPIVPDSLVVVAHHDDVK